MRPDRLPTSPYDASRYIGSVTYVSPDAVKINLPFAANAAAHQYAGYSVQAGQVGEFVFIEGEDVAVLGRVTEVRLPDNERLKAEPSVGERPDAHPIGFVQLLTTLDLASGRVVSGIPQHPRIGQHVFAAHPLLVKRVVEGNDRLPAGSIALATMPQDASTRVNISPSQLFGRHCAVLGATGGGKSWTVARIVQESAKLGGKVILVDPTGEFHTTNKSARHVYLGGEAVNEADERRFLCFPYWQLAERDLFAIFQPSPGSQVPKLREALKSLKLIHILNGGDQEPFVYEKRNTVRRDYNVRCRQHREALERDDARFDIQHLIQQIFEECVHETGGTNSNPVYENWGGYDDRTRGYCETLVSKVYSLTRTPSLRCLFEPERFENRNLTSEITDFIKSDQSVLRISMEHLSFEHNARELLTNALGRFLLNLARNKEFERQPTVVVLDEAHQFLSKGIGDEHNRVQLDAFGMIAKEGRKYGLTCVLATQRPRDIPEDVLSQIGMFVVHRLINERDREIVEKACGSLDASAAAFLPTLGQGEAILVGVDFPMPTPIKVLEPEFPPESAGPDYGKHWKTHR